MVIFFKRIRLNEEQKNHNNIFMYKSECETQKRKKNPQIFV